MALFHILIWLRDNFLKKSIRISIDICILIRENQDLCRYSLGTDYETTIYSTIIWQFHAYLHHYHNILAVAECTTGSQDAIEYDYLTHWGRVTHICVGRLTIIGSDNGLSPERRQAIIWTIAGILLIGPLGTNFSEILIEIQTLSLKKTRLKMSSAECCSFRLGLNALKYNSSKCIASYIILHYHVPTYYRESLLITLIWHRR